MNTVEMKSAILAKASPGDVRQVTELDPTKIQAVIPYKSLRDWIERVHELGELRVAKGVLLAVGYWARIGTCD